MVRASGRSRVDQALDPLYTAILKHIMNFTLVKIRAILVLKTSKLG